MKRLIDMTKEELEDYKRNSDELAAVFSQSWKDALEDAKNRKE